MFLPSHPLCRIPQRLYTCKIFVCRDGRGKGRIVWLPLAVHAITKTFGLFPIACECKTRWFNPTRENRVSPLASEVRQITVMSVENKTCAVCI